MMEQEGNDIVKDKNSENSGDWIIFFAVTVIFLIFFALFCIQFAGSVWDSCESADWRCLDDKGVSFRAAMGQFGDSIGGLMNPIIGLITVFLFVRSLRQNQEALKISRDELIETRKAVEQAVQAQENMEESLRAQLAEAKSQNNFSNYFKHLEEFSAYLGNFERYSDVKINLRQFHKLIFPDCLSGNYRPDIEFSNRFERLLGELWKAFGQLDTNCSSTVPDTIRLINELVTTFRISNYEAIIATQLCRRIDGKYMSGLDKKLKLTDDFMDLAADNIVAHINYLLLELQCYEYAMNFNISGSFAFNPYSSLLHPMIETIKLVSSNNAYIRGELGAVDSDGNIIYWESIIKLGRSY